MKPIIYIWFVLSFIVSYTQGSDIKDYLVKQLKDYTKIEYKIISPKNADLTKLKIDDSRELKVTRDLAYLPVIITENAEVKNSIFTLRLKLYKSVLVANRTIKKNEYLQAADFSIIVKEVSQLRFTPLESTFNFNEYKAKFNVPEKSVLQVSMIERIPEIEIGDRIEAVFMNNSLNIKFAATARSEGIAGKIIRVRRDDNRVFKARVINNKTVKIIE